MNRVNTRLGIALSIGLLVVAAGSVAAEDQVGTISSAPFTSSFTYVGQPELGTGEALAGKVRKTGETWQLRSFNPAIRASKGS